MSNKTTGAIWDLDLPHEQLLVLLALADHADHWGCHVRAEIAEIAWKTGYSGRQVSRIMADLVQNNLITLTNKGIGRGHVNEWDLHLENGIKKTPFEGKHDKMAGFTGKHVKMSSFLSTKENNDLDSIKHDKMAGFTGKHVKMSSFPEKHDKMAGFPSGEPSPFPSDSPSPKRETQDPPIAPPTAPAVSAQDGKDTASPGYSAIFERFWHSYPNKKNKGDAWRKWQQMQCSNIAERIIASVVEHTQSYDWLKDGGRYIPHPATFLHRRGWEDDLTPAPTVTKNPYAFKVQL